MVPLEGGKEEPRPAQLRAIGTSRRHNSAEDDVKSREAPLAGISKYA